MTAMIRLRRLAQINPPTPAFDRLVEDSEVTFMPLETVWADQRLDVSRVRSKATVAAGYVRFQAADVLCPKVTPTFQAGRSALIPELPSGVGAASTEVHVVRAHPGIADPRFVRYALLTKPFLEEGVSRFQGVAGLQRVPDDFLREFSVIDFTLEEQQRIADFLDDQVFRIDNIIEARRRQTDLADHVLQAEIERIWLPRQQAPMRHVLDVPREEDVPASWSIRPLGAFLSRITYGFTNPMPATDEGPYMLTAADIGDGQISYGTARRTSEEAFTGLITAKSRPETNDVLLTKDGTLGRVAEADGRPCCINQSVALLRPHAEYADGAIAEILRVRAYREALVFNAGGTAIKHLYISRVAAQKVAMPPSNVRASMVAESRKARSHFDFGLRSLTQSVELLHELKRSLITAAMMGDFETSAADGSRVPV
ncbi:hypothetical protein AB0J51_02970 [Micromonospora echinofusca]|uniref:restriction endonuclease subunit S n=1 Tax=Micromonospora echinofusca TaxID=47858 RepID=UPI00342745AE